jgi:hypothetical protein
MAQQNFTPETPTDLVVIVDDRPGELHRIARVLGAADINIQGMAAMTGRGRAVVHLLVTEPERAILALGGARLEARAARQTVVVNLPDRPDTLASALEPLARAGVNLELAYLAVGSRSETRAVLVVDDVDRALQVLEVSIT